MRTEKKVGSTTYNYYYADGLLIRQTWGTNYMDFLYDESGSAYSFIYNGAQYYYVKNLQGDVVRILNTSGTTVVACSYDAWGKCTITSGASNAIANANPIRYRGYYYDTDTGFYYLQSRYYDPAIKRFISADTYLNANGDFLGFNMYAYCGNNPITFRDSTGRWIETVFDLFSLGASTIEVMINPLDPWAWAGLIGDAVDLLPVLTGVGESVKALKLVKYTDEIADASHVTIKFIKASENASDFIDNGLDLAKTLNKTKEGFTISNRLTGIKIHKSFMENGMTIPGTKFRVDGMDKLTQTIFELKPYNIPSARRAVKQILNYNEQLGKGYKMVIVFY